MTEAQQRLVYSVDELAAVLGISRPNAYELCSRADFPAIRISPRRIVVPVDALRTWLAVQTEKAALSADTDKAARCK